MKKLLSLFLLLVMITSSAFQDTYVYVCKGPSATKYHYNKSCRGLSNCKSEIDKVTLAEAKEMGRELCGWED